MLFLATSLLILETAVGDAKSTQSFEPESLASGGAFPTWECSPPLASDSDSKSCAALASRTAVSRIISPAETHQVAMRIWKNECGSKVENLVSWKAGEEFPSLGIGHFIWYPEGKPGPFQETFPGFVKFCVKKGVKLPEILEKNKACPWKTRDEFLPLKDSQEVKELRKFLLDTVDLQTECIAERLLGTLDKIQAGLSDNKKKEISTKFDCVASMSSGLYALMDYVNFKGEGVLETERYKSQGWGLLQVLESMDLQKAKDAPIQEFCTAAKKVLTLRVENSPKERNEARWLQGWLNRIDTYQK